MIRPFSFPRYLAFACLSVVLAILCYSVGIAIGTTETKAEWITHAPVAVFTGIVVGLVYGWTVWGPILLTALFPGYPVFLLLHRGIGFVTDSPIFRNLLPAALISALSLYLAVVFTGQDGGFSEHVLLLFAGTPAAVLSASLILIRREEI